MSQTPLIGTGAIPSIPITGTSIGVTPTSPLTGTTLQQIIDELPGLLSTGIQAPTLLQTGETFTVADNRQVPYTAPVVIDGVLSIGANARFVEVN